MPGSASVRRRARGAFAPGAITVVAMVLAPSCGGDGPVDETVRDDRGAIVAPGRLGALELRTGDCFDASPEGADAVEVSAVPCSSGHDSEVVGLVTLTGDGFPGELVVDHTARTRCIDVFEGYVGGHFLLSELELRYFAPSERTWDDARDRDITCIAHRDDGLLVESVRHSAG